MMQLLMKAMKFVTITTDVALVFQSPGFLFQAINVARRQGIPIDTQQKCKLTPVTSNLIKYVSVYKLNLS